MYVIGPDMKVHSINAKNGELNWSFDPFRGEKYSGNSRVGDVYAHATGKYDV